MSFDTTHLTAKQQKTTNQRLIGLYVAGIVLSLLGALLYVTNSWSLFSFKTDLAENWSNIFTKYFFIIVALERAASVWTGLHRNAGKRAWDRRVSRVRELLEIKKTDLTLPELEQAYAREKVIIDEIEENQAAEGRDFLGVQAPKDGEATRKDELIGYLRATKQVYEFKRTKYEEETAKVTTRIVFVGGIALALIGLSFFNDILDPSSLDDQTYWLQKYMYRLGDIFITGGLLGGGSKSFNVFINTLDQMFNRLKDPKGEN